VAKFEISEKGAVISRHLLKLSKFLGYYWKDLTTKNNRNYFLSFSFTNEFEISDFSDFDSFVGILEFNENGDSLSCTRLEEEVLEHGYAHFLKVIDDDEIISWGWDLWWWGYSAFRIDEFLMKLSRGKPARIIEHIELVDLEINVVYMPDRSAAITFMLPQETHASFMVYDIRGRREDAITGYFQEGQNRILLSSLSSGIHFYIFNARNIEKKGRLLIIGNE
jgi:hypothetical protein